MFLHSSQIDAEAILAREDLLLGICCTTWSGCLNVKLRRQCSCHTLSNTNSSSNNCSCSILVDARIGIQSKKPTTTTKNQQFGKWSAGLWKYKLSHRLHTHFITHCPCPRVHITLNNPEAPTALPPSAHNTQPNPPWPPNLTNGH